MLKDEDQASHAEPDSAEEEVPKTDIVGAIESTELASRHKVTNCSDC